MHDKWMKEWFSKPCFHALKEYIYQVICHLKTTKLLFRVQQLCILQRNQRKVVLGH